MASIPSIYSVPDPMHPSSEDTPIICNHVPVIRFTVVKWMDVVPTCKALRVELERQTCKWTVGAVLWEPRGDSDPAWGASGGFLDINPRLERTFWAEGEQKSTPGRG